MEQYLGVKLVEAETMTLGDYNNSRGWTIPENEDPAREGYRILYPDGYISWSPKEIFEDAYRRVTGVSFGLAIEAMKKGYCVRRSGWNGKGMFLYYVPEGEYPAVTKVAKEHIGDTVPYGAYIAMKTAQGNVVPWLASQTDMLSDDWQLLMFESDFK
jgi:hypothetical protein